MPKREPAPIEYVCGESPLLNSMGRLDHRELVWACPHCGQSPEDRDAGWYKPGMVRQVVLYSSHWTKLDSVIVIGECPNCHELSWVHRSLSIVSWESESEESVFYGGRARIKAEDARRREEAKREWRRSPCSTCTHMSNHKDENYYHTRDCDAGHFGAIPQECDEYEAKRVPKPQP